MTLIIIIIIFLFFNLFIYVQHFTHNVTLNIKREKCKSLLFKQNKLYRPNCCIKHSLVCAQDEIQIC